MIVLMKCVAEAIAAKGVRGLFGLVPGGAFLFEVAADALRRLRERHRAADLREEVLSAASATLDEVKQAAAEVVKEVAPTAPIEEQIALEMYLTQIPGAVRQSLKRPEDPSGKTVPADFVLNEPADLLKRLPQRPVRFRPDDALPGKPGWKLVELLGTGGFGEVWLARNPSLSALRGAVKFGLDPQARDRLLRHEGSLVNRVMEQGKHPNVVQLLDAHLDGDAPWLMYEYIPGGDLTGLILSWQQLSPDERVARTTAALQTLASAVGHFHRLSPPLVHRDLKPANVLLSSKFQVPSSREQAANLEPGTWNLELKVADFGIGGVAAAAALAQEASGRGATGVMVSQLYGSYTPLYASPQQQRGEPPHPRDDVHALGVIGYQMLTGRFDATLGADYAKTLRRLAVPEPLIELLGDCAAHDPENRPKDAAELAERLAKLPTPTLAPSDNTFEMSGAKSAEPKFTFLPGGTAVPPKSKSEPSAPRPVEATPEPRPRLPEPEFRRLAPPTGVPRRWWAWSTLFVLIITALPAVVLIGGVVVLFGGLLDRKPGADTRMTAASPDVPASGRGWRPAVLTKTIPVAGKATGLQVSPDGKFLAATVEPPGGPKLVTLIRPYSGTVISSYPLAGGFGFSPDSDSLVVARHAAPERPEGVQVVNTSTGEDLSTFTPLTPLPAWLGYTPGGNAVLGIDQKVHRWLVASPSVNPVPITYGDGRNGQAVTVTTSSRVVFDRTGKFFAITSRGEKTAFGEVATSTVAREVGTADDRLCVFTKNGNLVTWDGKNLTEWETKTGKSVGVPHPTMLGEPVQLLLTDDDRWLVAVGTKNAAYWGRHLDWISRQVSGHNGRVIRAALNPKGSVMATLDDKWGIRIRKMTDPDEHGDEVAGHTGQIHDIQFAEKGDRLVGAGDTRIFVWTVPNPNPGQK